MLLLLNWSGIFRFLWGIDTAIFITLLAGYKTFYNSVSALLEKRISADIALCVAVIAALAVGEYRAAAEAMFIVLVGEGLESFAAGRTAAAIGKFVEQLPRTARLVRDNAEEEIQAELLLPGDLISVRAGERIPADGVVERGFSYVNEASITGEPLPREKVVESEVFSGSLNGNGLLYVRVTRSGPNTTIARVIQLVKEAQERPAPVERLADRFAKYFLPALLLSAALTFYFTRDWSRTVAVLIVACPCALILATPTAMVAAMGGLARRGILVRGGAVLERAAKVNMVVFDKTGTLTEGRFEVIRALATGVSETELLQMSAAAAASSGHPLALALQREAERRDIVLLSASEHQSVPGRGVRARVDGHTVVIGSRAFLEDEGVAAAGTLLEEADQSGASTVLAAVDGRLTGAILFRDRLRTGALDAVAALRGMGIERQVLLTGDRRRAAEIFAREAGIQEVFAELLPEQKLDRLREWTASGARTAMVGDGLNDAPALASATVGIAVAGATDITSEAASVVYLPESLEQLPELFLTSRSAVRTAWQNILLFAVAFNAGAVLLAASGRIGPVGAAVTHQLSSFFVMLNSLRLLHVRREGAAKWVARLSGWPAYKWVQAAPVQRIFRRAQDHATRFEFDALAGWFVANRRRIVKPAIVLAAAAFVLDGFYAIRPNETGVIERFGKKLLPYREPGLHYKLPWPVDKLTRVEAHRIRAVELGFRSNAAGAANEPAAYEWNVQHRTGRFERVPEEALMFTGDQNLVEVNASIHYSPVHPDDFLFRQLDGDATVRAAAEGVLEALVTQTALDDLLTVGRKKFEAQALHDLQAKLDAYGAGVNATEVRLEDVHPSLEVVDAFREVSGAYEEKNRVINEAEGYRNEQLALARGNAEALRRNAVAYQIGRTNRAGGDASRFQLSEAAFRSAAPATEHRLYLETMESVLPGKRKMILDHAQGKRHLMLLDDGVELPLTLRPPQER